MIRLPSAFSLFVIALFGLILMSPGFAIAKNPSPVVIELFTSQDCSECLPADELASQIAHNPDNHLFVLACHVTTWDHRGWQDTLSLPECSERQRNYSDLLAQGRAFTPQIVVNGKSSVRGDRNFDIDLAVRKARQSTALDPIEISMNERGFTLNFPELPAGQRIPYEVTVMTYMTNHTVSITAGENRGKTVTYAHPVSGVIRQDQWQGEKETRLIPFYKLPSAHLHGIVVVAQPVPGGPVRAAGEYRIYFQ